MRNFIIAFIIAATIMYGVYRDYMRRAQVQDEIDRS